MDIMDVIAASQALEAVLEQIDDGELKATTAQRAYIAGALDSLMALSQPDS